MKVSVIIPARNEPYLARTIKDLLAKAAGDIEIIPVLDGYDAKLPQDQRVKSVRKPQAEGMRPAINSGAAVATGDYLMKIDAHCMVSEGFDEVLAADCDRDWVVVPRRFALNPAEWKVEVNGKYPIDAHYLEYPFLNPNAPGFHGRPWRERGKAHADIPVDDEMSSQGSCWFMSAYQFQRLALMATFGYGTFAQEFQEIGLKTWLSGGRVVVNKRAWYAHWHKTEGRGYPLPHGESDRSARWTLEQWWNNSELDKLIERFWPVPGWPANWREIGWISSRQ